MMADSISITVYLFTHLLRNLLLRITRKYSRCLCSGNYRKNDSRRLYRKISIFYYDCNCRSKINCCCTRQSLNPSGLTAFDCGAQPPTQIQKYFYKDFKTDISESLSTHFDMSPMTLYIMISTCQTLETRLKDSQIHKYTDRMEHPEILATNLMKQIKITRRLKKNYSRLVYLIVL